MEKRMKDSESPGFLSIIIPVKDEGLNISDLAAEINETMSLQPVPWEVMWVDDGSTDETLDILRELNGKDARHRYLSFQSNSGQSAALMAGLSESRGNLIATLDGDGQNDPKDLPKILSLLLAGEADMVNGYRARRKDKFVRKLSSWLANGFRNLTTGKSVRDVGCSTRVFKKGCAVGLPLFKGLHRFLPTLVAMRGFRIIEVPVNHRPRLRGATKYGIHNRLWAGLYDVFGVMWLKRRGLQYIIRERSEGSSEWGVKDG